MEVHEETVGSKDYKPMIKGKRTKRQSRLQVLALTMPSTSSSTAEAGCPGGVSDNSAGFSCTTASPTHSVEFTKSTEVEQDMANCLILLAQGQTQKLSEVPVVATINKIGYVYQCQTCDRCFPSFQALGGHRASHKRPKLAVPEEKKVMLPIAEDELERINHNNSNTTLSLQISSRVSSCSFNNNKSRVHRCSICGAEFNSGQALGGHMRRHRALPPMVPSIPNESQESKKPRNLLSLDLNLPPPEDDHRESKFPFAMKEQVIVFSASALVDCHH